MNKKRERQDEAIACLEMRRATENLEEKNETKRDIEIPQKKRKQDEPRFPDTEMIQDTNTEIGNEMAQPGPAFNQCLKVLIV
jgi:hypothetical protein